MKRESSRSRAGDKTKGEFFFSLEEHENFHCSGGEKMRNASGHRCKVKTNGSERK